MHAGPLLAVAPDPSVPQQERVDPILGSLAVIQQVCADADQVTYRLLGR
jgi:hypothetical protein